MMGVEEEQKRKKGMYVPSVTGLIGGRRRRRRKEPINLVDDIIQAAIYTVQHFAPFKILPLRSLWMSRCCYWGIYLMS